MTRTEQIIDKIEGREKVKPLAVFGWVVVLLTIATCVMVADYVSGVSITDQNQGIGRAMHDLGQFMLGAYGALFSLYLFGRRPVEKKVESEPAIRDTVSSTPANTTMTQGQLARYKKDWDHGQVESSK